jgi:hypothetical protein
MFRFQKTAAGHGGRFLLRMQKVPHWRGFLQPRKESAAGLLR